MEELRVVNVKANGRFITLIRSDGCTLSGPKVQYTQLERELLEMAPMKFELSNEFWKVLLANCDWGCLNK